MGNQSGSDRGGLFHRTDLLAVYAQRQETPESTGKTHSTKGILQGKLPQNFPLWQYHV